MRGSGSFREVVHEPIVAAASTAGDDDDDGDDDGLADLTSATGRPLGSGNGPSMSTAPSSRTLRPFCVLLRDMRVEFDLTEK